MIKKLSSVAIITFTIILVFSGCKKTNEFRNENLINVISREDGSGTRGAFTDIFDLVLKGNDGSRKDMSTKEAVIAKQTDVLMVSIANDKYAIGYISLGSLNDTIKAVSIDNTAPSGDTVKNGNYSVVRPFNIVTNGEPDGITKDFIQFILSGDGQAVVADSYIPVSDDTPAYSGTQPSGKVVVAGSSSVTPIMEKLKERYLLLNPNASVEIQQSDSSSGIMGTLEGTCDIGMSSRNLKDSETGQLVVTKIAIDGIAIVVNKDNPIDNMSKDQIKKIFTGEFTKWSEAGQ